MFACVVGQNSNQYTGDSPDVIQQQTGNVVLDSSHSQLPRTEIDRQKCSNKLLSIPEEGRVGQEVKQKGERVQPKTYRSPVGVLTESYKSLREEELEQTGHGTVEDGFFFTEKRKRDEMLITCGNDSNDTDKKSFDLLKAAGKVVFVGVQFAHCPALNETLVVITVEN